MGSVIKVINHVERCYSNEDGQIIYDIIDGKFRNGEKVQLSFSGINGVTSSFVNTALIDLLDKYDINFVKGNLRFTDSTKQINTAINDRFKYEVKKRTELVEC
ncbi:MULTISPECIES: STAS-like domain-containing protein [Bacillus subtilis group]|uniref:STAS-like domain-containing protein n=1 Tax=Bacillus subtilis group TaxID=653685 RepID=UPI000E59C67F|nr:MULTISPECIES: STAS-like domain-containing protein [Bacillus subtilis group]MCY7829345.1 STAS-like domain-containing protein [Bacillus spizizenii]MBJ3766976.1 STAS-like domain-containing protein [Bacillus subtilis]MCM3248664.1 STAS-like domain-containing protein [Bacillus amyloliquefaciens]MCY7426944.1 STAS-like domain-containing protein [Bacillus amyloliquefaciens]MCY7839372.1 STAS-like domain-containing protein [Bacillus spizizenii]